MKVSNIKREEEYSNIYVVTLVPNWFEKLFGVKEKTKRYKDTGSIYRFGGGNVYINEKGEKLGNGSKIGNVIDKWRNAF